MDLKLKRRAFFIIVGVLYCVLFGMVFLIPVLRWADNLTMQGVMPLGIPFSQFLAIISSIGMAIIVTVLFYVDTTILVKKDEKKQAEKKAEGR